MQMQDNTMALDRGMHIEDTEKRYNLTCLVKRKICTLSNNGTKYEARIIYLVPEASGEMIRFYDAYLPEYVTEVNNNELVFLNIKTGNPFRGFLSPATKEINERHIFIMSNPEKELLDRIFTEGMKINVECVPFGEQKDFDV